MKNMTNEEKVKCCAASNPLYHFFEKNDFWNNCTATIEKTIWQGKESENSLCFSHSTNSKEQIGKLISIFLPQNKVTFREKFEQAVGGNGNEGRKIMTLHSSSLLSLLCFYNVTKDHPLTISIPEINGEKDIVFTESEFEVPNDVTYAYRNNNPNINSNPSNMDIVLKSNDYTLFLESKFSEYLKNGLVSGIKKDVYDQIYDDLQGFLNESELKCEDEDGKDTIKLRAKSGNTKNYLAGIKQMISHFMAVCNYACQNKDEEVILGSILYQFEPKIYDKEHFGNYVKLYGELIDALDEIKNSNVPNLTLLRGPLTYQEVFQKNKNLLDEKVATYYKLADK